MEHKNACTGCSLEHSDKDNSLCLYCDRRIQYVKGQTVSAPFPSLEMIEKIKKGLRYKYDMSHTNLVTASKDKVCKKCGGAVSKNSKSGICSVCYDQSGGVCWMDGCKVKLSPHNKSGLCRYCASIVYNRKKLGLPLYAPVKRRNRKKR